MIQTVLYALGASLPLATGAALGVRWRPPHALVATGRSGRARYDASRGQFLVMPCGARVANRQGSTG